MEATVSDLLKLFISESYDKKNVLQDNKMISFRRKTIHQDLLKNQQVALYLIEMCAVVNRYFTMKTNWRVET